MVVDSRVKGARGETTVRDLLRKLTGLTWERVPGSGALNEKHQLKGDLYIPGEKNHYCVEVKNYEDDHVTSQLLTSKNPQLIEWWQQTIRQGQQVSKKPLLIFKHNRSKIFVAFLDFPSSTYPFMYIERNDYNFYISLLEDWVKHEQPKFI